MATVFKPPHHAPPSPDISVFLAGSIDMGAALDWQQTVATALDHLPIIMFNPRRDGWDHSWKQDISNADFRQQVEWELDHLDRADLIVFYFDPNGRSPISLLELGLHATSGKCIACCPRGYWRRGNVQVVCNRYNIPLFATLDELIDAAKANILLIAQNNAT